MVKRFIVLLIIVWCAMLAVVGADSKQEPRFYDEVVGTYAIKIPSGDKNLLYVTYFKKADGLYFIQTWDKRVYKLDRISDNPIKLHSVGDGYDHVFSRDNKGRIDGVIASKGKLHFSGAKRPEIEKIRIGDRYSREALMADFDQLVSVILYLHPAKYDYISESQFKKLVDATRKQLNRPMRMHEFYATVTPLMASIGCAHSFIQPTKSYRQDPTLRYLPLELSVIDRRLFIRSVVGKQRTELIGAELISINGTSVSKMIPEMMAAISSDWNNPQYKVFALNQRFRYLFYYLYGSATTYRLQYRGKGDRRIQALALSGIDREANRDWLKKRRQRQRSSQASYRLEIKERGSIALLSIRHFEFYKNKDEKAFKSFVDRTFYELRQKGIRKLILDIRGNMGGSPIVSQYLLSFLIQKPFRYFMEIHSEGYQQLYDPVHPAEDLFKGEIVLLADNGCLSTSGHFISLYRYHRVGKIVGVETGTTFTCTDASMVMHLVHTDIWLKIARRRFTAAVKGFTRGEGIVPDFVVKSSVEDMVNNRDRQMEKAIEILKYK